MSLLNIEEVDSYSIRMNELCRKIVENDLKYKNTVIIGDNSVGKTELLKMINEKVEATYIECFRGVDRSVDTPKNTVLFDNVELILDYSDILNISEWLSDNFRGKRIMLTTHSIELVSRLKDFNLIVLYRGCYVVMDSNDFNSYDAVSEIFVNSINKSDEDTLKLSLINLLHLKLSNNWTPFEDSVFLKIKSSDASGVHKTIIKQIESL